MNLNLDEIIIQNKRNVDNKNPICNSLFDHEQLQEYEQLCHGPHSLSTPNHCKLFIANVNYSVTAQDLEGLFGYFGKVCRAVVHYDEYGYPLQTAEVIFSNFADGIKALNHYNHSMLDGKLIIIRLMDTFNNLSNYTTAISDSFNWVNLNRSNSMNSLDVPSTKRHYKRQTHAKNYENLTPALTTVDDLDADLEEYLSQRAFKME